MRTTLTLTVDQELAQFIHTLPGTTDPSALINYLFHEEMRQKGVTINPELIEQNKQDELSQTIELFMDENTNAAG